MSKDVLHDLPPLTLLTIQLTTSITVLWIAVLASPVRVRLDRNTGRASLTGILEPGLSYTFGVVGLTSTTASNYALIGAAEPLFILLLAWFLLRERVGTPTLALGVMTAVGIWLVITPGVATLRSPHSFFGDALILISTFFAALYVVATRKIVSVIPPLFLSALQQSVGLAWTLGALLAALLLGLTRLGLHGFTSKL